MTLEKSKRISGKERAAEATKITLAYSKGKSIRQIADTTGRSYGWVHRILSENDTQLRPRGGANRAKKGNRNA